MKITCWISLDGLAQNVLHSHVAFTVICHYSPHSPRIAFHTSVWSSCVIWACLFLSAICFLSWIPDEIPDGATAWVCEGLVGSSKSEVWFIPWGQKHRRAIRQIQWIITGMLRATERLISEHPSRPQCKLIDTLCFASRWLDVVLTYCSNSLSLVFTFWSENVRELLLQHRIGTLCFCMYESTGVINLGTHQAIVLMMI